MATKQVVDTHALVWFLEGNSRLGTGAKGILEEPASELVVSVIVLAEACWIIEKAKTSIPDTGDFLMAVRADPRVNIVPLDEAILERSLQLTAIDEMHDRLIVATALVLLDQGHSVNFLSKDAVVRSAGVVTVVWD